MSESNIVQLLFGTNIFHCQGKNYHVGEKRNMTHVLFLQGHTRAHSFSFFTRKKNQEFSFSFSFSFCCCCYFLPHFLSCFDLSVFLSPSKSLTFFRKKFRGQFSTQSPPFRMQFAHSTKFLIPLNIQNSYFDVHEKLVLYTFLTRLIKWNKVIMIFHDFRQTKTSVFKCFQRIRFSVIFGRNTWIKVTSSSEF